VLIGAEFYHSQPASYPRDLTHKLSASENSKLMILLGDVVSAVKALVCGK
jgi:hypothetical protein